MEHLIDFTVDPCKDFFAFSCSAKTRGKEGPFPRQRLPSKDELLTKIDFPKNFDYMRRFYLSCGKIDTLYTTEQVLAQCVDPDGLYGETCKREELEEYGDIYGQMLDRIQEFFTKTAFPAVTENWEETAKARLGEQWNWETVAAVVLKDYFYLAAYNKVGEDKFRSNVFFAPLINTKAKEDNDIHEIFIVPLTILPSYLNSDPRYKLLIENVLKAFGGNTSAIEADASRILEMQRELEEIGLFPYFSHDDFRDQPGVDYKRIKLLELANAIPNVQWTSYIQAALDHNQTLKIDKNTTVIVPRDMEPLKELGRLVGTSGRWKIRDQANLLIWRMFAKFANDFMNTGSERGDLQDSPWDAWTRKESCLDQINDFFPNAYNDLTIAEHVDEKTTSNIKAWFKDLQDEFVIIIDEQKWMSSTTKEHAKDKALAMKINVGDRSPKTSEYRRLSEKMASDDYIGNILEIGNYHFDSLVKKLGQPVEEDYAGGKDYVDEQEWNAYYFQTKNEIFILTGLLHGFFGLGLDFDIPAGLLYGGFRTLGHEMVHGFDDSGRTRDKDGVQLNWWKPSEAEEYENRTQYMVKARSSILIVICSG